MKYLFFTNTGKAPDLQLPHGISIRKRMPRMFVAGMTEMNLGKRTFLHILFRVVFNTFKGVRPVFREYDCIRDGKVVCKAVLMSRISNVAFMPKGGLFYTFGETLAAERGKGYATLLHRYVLATMPDQRFLPRFSRIMSILSKALKRPDLCVMPRDIWMKR